MIMNWLRGLIYNWLHQYEQPKQRGVEVNPSHNLQMLVHEDNNATISVSPITNGFLLSQRRSGPYGPDMIDATFVGTPDELGPTLVSLLAQQRLKP